MIIQHRVNDLKISNIADGIEIDLRFKNKIIMQHDIDKDGFALDLNELNKLRHELIILNIKESGIEDLLINDLPDNCYFLDSQIPDIIKHSKNGFKRFILRVSKYEELNKNMMDLVKPKYIWVDYDYFNFSKKEFDIFLNYIENTYNAEKILVHPSVYGISTQLIDIPNQWHICRKIYD